MNISFVNIIIKKRNILCQSDYITQKHLKKKSFQNVDVSKAWLSDANGSTTAGRRGS